MKRILSLLCIFTIFLILIIGCAKEEAAGETPTSPSAQGAVKTAAGTGTTEPVEFDPKVQKLISKFNEKVKTYSYYHTYKGKEQKYHKYFVRLDHNVVKIELYEVNRYKKESYYDTVYLDLSQQTARGYCMDNRIARCDDVWREFKLNYGDWLVKFPHEWIEEISPSAKVITSETIDQRKADVIMYEKDGKIYKIWLDTTFGLPLKVQIEKPEDTVLEMYAFRDMAVSGLTEQDLTPPTGKPTE